MLILFGFISCEQKKDPPNILFILADDLGYGELGAYGQQLIETPNLDELRRQGMKFNHFYAPAPVCAPPQSSPS